MFLSAAECLPSSPVFEVGKYLVWQFVDKLVEAQVDFSLYLIIEELFTEFMECVVSTVVVQVQRIENVPGKWEGLNKPIYLTHWP